MANPEHLNILQEGIGWWNDWRKKTRVFPDLDGAHLPGANLSGADLSGADLSEADLVNADLSEANLMGANLIGVYLLGANLKRANLTHANFSAANLSGANLSGAKLGGAHLRGVDLRGADLTDADLSRANLREAETALCSFARATCGGTVFVNLDLSRARGLDQIIHHSPSSIGLDTLYLSGGSIPESFLRGAGVPDDFIKYVPSLFSPEKAVQFYSCFISYSHKDEEFTQRLFSGLRDKHLRVWYAPEDMKAGGKLFSQIDEAIRVHDKLLLILSDASILSEWVMTEIRRARQRELKEKRQVLFPIRLMDMTTLKEWTCFDGDTGKDLAVEVREYYIPDFSNWKDHDDFQKAFNRLVQDLRNSEER